MADYHQPKFMRIHSKLVAATLAVTLLALPAMAVVSCWLHGSAIAHASDCPMKGRHLALASLQRALPGAACCELSSGNAMPTSVAQGLTATGDAAIPTPIVSSHHVSPVTPATKPTEPLRAFGSTAQATLCIFLI
jgi:hypothetical protein